MAVSATLRYVRFGRAWARCLAKSTGSVAYERMVARSRVKSNGEPLPSRFEFEDFENYPAPSPRVGVSKEDVSQEKVTSEILTKWLMENNAEDVQVLPVKGKSLLADEFVVATAKSTPHLRKLTRLCRQSLRRLDKKGREFVPTVEGTVNDPWVVVDGDEGHGIMVHLFLREERAKYRLEELWGEHFDAIVEAVSSGEGTVAWKIAEPLLQDAPVGHWADTVGGGEDWLDGFEEEEIVQEEEEEEENIVVDDKKVVELEEEEWKILQGEERGDLEWVEEWENLHKIE